MRSVRLIWILALVSTVAFPVGSVAAGGVDRSNDRGVFVNAGWDLVYPDGSEGYLVVEASGPADPRAPGTLVSVYGSRYRVVTCDGVEELWVRDVNAEGTGSVVVAPQLSRGTLRATLDVTITVRDPCTGIVTERVRHDVMIGLSLRPTGPVRHDASGTSQLVPSLGVTHQRVQVRVRSASGPVVMGASTIPSGWGEFGRIHGVWQVRARSDAPMILLQARSRLAAATQHERLRFASATDERYGRDRLRFLEVDAVRSRDGGVVVSLYGYRARTVACPGGGQASIETSLYGEGPGTLRFGGHMADASVAATFDLVELRSDGCAGRLVERTFAGVPVALAIAADGPSVTTVEWVSLRTPGETSARVWIGTRARSAGGSFTVGDVLYEPTTWGAIGWFRARAHGDV